MKLDLWQREREAAQVLPCGLKVSKEENPPVLRVWKPKAEKPYVHYRFRSIDERDRYLERTIANFEEWRKVKADWKAKREQGDETLANPGAIFEHSWGYDQTNLDYYQVIERQGKRVVVRQIGSHTVEGSEGFMSDSRLPVKDSFLSPRFEGDDCGIPFVKVLKFSEGKPYLPMKFGWCGLWDGRAHYCSWYA